MAFHGKYHRGYVRVRRAQKRREAKQRQIWTDCDRHKITIEERNARLAALGA